MGNFKKYNYLINEISNNIFPATDFYFYPVTAQNYADMYKNYNVNKYPVMAFIYLTNKCSDDCVGCFAKSIEDGDAYLDFSVISSVLSDLASNGTLAVKFAGREPTTYPYLSECLDLCAKFELKSLVISSGAEIHKHIDSLSESCTHLRLSLNTVSQELHDKIHNPTSKALKFDERIYYTKQVIKRRKINKLVTGATYLIRDQNDFTALEYAQMCKDMGFDYVRYTVLDSNKNNGDRFDKWEKIYYRLLAKESDDFKIIVHSSVPFYENIAKDEKLIDPALVSRVVIHANGRVNSCHEGWRGKWEIPNLATYGNINETSFYDIWTGQRRKDFLDNIISTHKKGFEKTGSCITGNMVCNHNCKYDSFNYIEKWMINELSEYPNSVFTPIFIDDNWYKNVM